MGASGWVITIQKSLFFLELWGLCHCIISINFTYPEKFHEAHLGFSAIKSSENCKNTN